MPWYEKLMKDATTCDKPRIGGNNLRPVDLRIGQPVPSNVGTSTSESIGCVKTTRGTETSQYPEEQKSTEILLVAVSERGRGQTAGACPCGVVGPQHGMHDARVKRPGMARQRR